MKKEKNTHNTNISDLFSWPGHKPHQHDLDSEPPDSSDFERESKGTARTNEHCRYDLFVRATFKGHYGDVVEADIKVSRGDVY